MSHPQIVYGAVPRKAASLVASTKTIQQGVLQVKALNFWSALLAAVTILSSGAMPAWAQNTLRPGVQGSAPRVATAPAAATAPPASASAGTSVAVIDLQEVFKQHIMFNRERNNIKKDTDALKAKMLAEQKKLQGMVEELKEFKNGTPEYKQREEQIAHVDSQVRVQLQLESKTLRESEAKLYYRAYEEVLAAVEQFAVRNGISLVIRFSADEIDRNNPESIMMGLNRHVVYQRNLNITKFVIEDINRGVPPENTTIGGDANRNNKIGPTPIPQRRPM
jgi:Skp family chaperone for outer membrane proteins